MTGLFDLIPPRGRTYVPAFDRDRLAAQQLKVFAFMEANPGWHTLAEIHAATGAPEASVSARLREFDRLPGHRKEKRRRRPGGGQYEYRLVVTEGE